MEFPRGKFIGIKRGLHIKDLLDELMQLRFTGYCIIALGKESGSLVFKNGKCILAECGDLSGNAAWKVIQELDRHDIDAQLMELSPAKLDLAREFNTSAWIDEGKRQGSGHIPRKAPGESYPEKVGQVATVRRRRADRESLQAGTGMGSAEIVSGGTQEASTPPGKTAESLPAANGPLTAPATGGGAVPEVRTGSPADGQGAVLPEEVAVASAREDETAITRVQQDEALDEPFRPDRAVIANNSIPIEETETASQGFIRELASLDAMEIKNMNEKIRENCRVILQGLHLEHLLEQDEHTTKD